MNNDTDKLIKDQVNSLPLNVRESINRIPWKNKIKDIAKREGLDEEKSTALETETMFILFGFLSFETYVENIIREIGLDQEMANRISDSVYNEIILEIQKQFEMIEAISQKEPPKMEIPVAPKPLEPKTETPSIQKITTVEIPPANLPMIEPGEVVHDTTPKVSEARIMNQESGERDTEVRIKNQEASNAKSNTKSAYEGPDPYREPLD